jgi:hypothetical protein
LAAHILHHVEHDGQAQTQAFSHVFGREEWVYHLGPSAPAQPHTVVGDDQFYQRIRPGLNTDPARAATTLFDCINRIADNVQKHLLNQDLIARNRKTMGSRKSTAPGSPVSLSTRLSMRKERLKLIVTGSNVSPMRASDAAVCFCLAA